MKRLILPAIAMMAAAALPVRGSTPAAWAASAKAASAACIKASGLKAARASAPLIFSDTIGRSALLVTGIFPQPFMKDARGTMLCLYDRRSGRAEAQEAKGWTAPR